MIKAILKIQDNSIFDFSQDSFVWKEGKVQGAKIALNENKILILSPRRYKLDCKNVDFVKIISLSGEGHFKWAKGEKTFLQEDCFTIQGDGEYELNGNGQFLVIKQ